MPQTRSILLAAALVVLATAVGCDSGPHLVTVTGVVKREGQPVSHAAVIFNPDPSNSTVLLGEAVTDAQGNYRLISDERNGAAPGKYHVIIQRAAGEPAAAAASGSNVDPGGFEDDPYMASLTRGDGFIEPNAKKSARKKSESQGPAIPGANEKYTFDIEVAGKGGAIDFDLNPNADSDSKP